MAEQSVAQEIFGIECEHHYGITTHPLPEDGDFTAAAYRIMRASHHFLTDDNHDWRAVACEPWSRIDVTKNAASPAYRHIPGFAPSWLLADGPGAHWFTQRYRVATRASLEAEIADRLAWAERWEAEASEQRDTLRGRKRRDELARFAAHKRSEAAFIAKRWPQYLRGCPSASNAVAA